MKLFVLTEHCEGEGTQVMGVFTSLEKAKEAAENCHWNFHLDEEEPKPWEECRSLDKERLTGWDLGEDPWYHIAPSTLDEEIPKDIEHADYEGPAIAEIPASEMSFPAFEKQVRGRIQNDSDTDTSSDT